MSEFGVLDCIIRDSGGISNSFDDRNDFERDENNWQNGGFDVLSASMHDSGLLGSNGLQENNEVKFVTIECSYYESLISCINKYNRISNGFILYNRL